MSTSGPWRIGRQKGVILRDFSAHRAHTSFRLRWIIQAREKKMQGQSLSKVNTHANECDEVTFAGEM